MKVSRWAVVIAVGSVLLFVVALIVFLTSPESVQTRPNSSALRVVTTTPVLYSLAVSVVGDAGTVTNLVPPGSSPENYALRPQDANELSQADVLVMNGLNFEMFLGGAAVEAQRRGTRVVIASEGVGTLGNPPNPHIWLDPLRAIQMVQNIVVALEREDQAHAAHYRQRAALVEAQLRELDADFSMQLNDLSEKNFVGFHPAWDYFAERYGLRQVAVVEKVPGVEPTAQDLAELIQRMRDTDTHVLLTEPELSPKIVEALARDLDLRTAEVNPEGGILTADGYEQMMRENVATFVKALSGGDS